MEIKTACPVCGSHFTYILRSKNIVCRKCGEESPPLVQPIIPISPTACPNCHSPKVIFKSRANAYLCQECGELTSAKVIK
jgi:transcription initiation factor TFIIIB Brf1 subunit/transcription initiation factor TFIIB